MVCNDVDQDDGLDGIMCVVCTCEDMVCNNIDQEDERDGIISVGE